MKEKKNKEHILSSEAEQLLRSYKINTRIEKAEVLARLLDEIEQKKQTPVRKISWYVAAASVAATAAVLIAFWFFTATETINSSSGDTYAFRLPDDSRVVLHDGSTLSYRKFLWNRNVKLIGEAYFEVEKGSGFHVTTNQGEVEVLGTRFLVNEYDNQLTVQCYEGKVKTNFNDSFWILEAGSRFTGINDAAEIETVVNENEYPGFAKFNQKFHNVSLPEVVHEIEQFFDVEIILKEHANKRFSGSIQTGNLDNALQIVCEPLQIDYVFKNKYRITIY